MSTFKVDTLQSTTGGVTTLTKQSAAKAYASYDNGSTLTETFNVSSGVDNSTGSASLNLTNSMSTSTYMFNGVAIGAANTTAAIYEGTLGRTSSRVDYNTTIHTSGSTTISLNDFVSLTVLHGDLA